MKKIMIVVPYLSDGGAERVASLWSSFLSERYNVLLLTYYNVDNEYIVDEKVERRSLVTNKSEYDKIGFFKKIRMIRKIINEFNPNTIIPFLSHTNIAVSLANKRKETIVFQTIRNNPWLNPKSRFFRLLRDYFIRKEKKLIVQNNEQSEYFTSKKIRKYIVCNPVNPQTLENENLKKEYTSIKKIIAVGRLHEQKNYKMMIDSIYEIVYNHHLDVCLHIYGEGPLKDVLEKYIKIKHLDNFVSLKGRSNNILSIEKEYDLFIMTSNYEGFPNSLLEAMAIGLPVVSTNCKTGPKDLIENGVTGYLVNVDDYVEMANTIIEINDRFILKKIGTNASRFVTNKYSQAASFNQLVDAIEDNLN